MEWNSIRKLINLPNEWLIGLSIRSINKIIVAKTTLLSACVLPTFHNILFIFMLNNKNCCRHFTFSKQLNIEDYFYPSFDLILILKITFTYCIITKYSSGHMYYCKIRIPTLCSSCCCCCSSCSSSSSSSCWIQPLKWLTSLLMIT